MELMEILTFSPSAVIYLFHGTCFCTQKTSNPQGSALNSFLFSRNDLEKELNRLDWGKQILTIPEI